MPREGREDRPDDASYFVVGRSRLLSQGDIFGNVPRTYPSVSSAVQTDALGKRRFISGPLDVGYAMLITPTCSMSAQGADGYAHPVRTVVPLVSAAEALEARSLTAANIEQARRYDELNNYMYLPPLPGEDTGAMLALLYMPITLGHELLVTEGRLLQQLQETAAKQLLRKLVRYQSGYWIPREVFSPDMT